MDPRQFDALSRTVAGGVSRRQALARFGAAGVLAGLIGALGRDRPVHALPRAQTETCRLVIVATVRLGPSADALLQGEKPGELRGEISVALGADGAIDRGRLRLGGGQELPVVGQATGRAIDLRVEAGIGQALVFTGTAQQPLARCQGAVDGLFTGPQAGDLGDWHATATAIGEVPDGVAAVPTATPVPPSAPTATITPTATPAAAATATAAATGTTSPTATATTTAPPTDPPTPAPTETPTPEPPTPTPELPPTPTPVVCPAGTTDCGGVCLDLQNDVNNCGACGNVCPEGQPGFVRGCVEGTCFFMRERACAEGLASCGGVCVDVLADPANCGLCGNACGSGEICFAGVCAREHRCGAGLTECADICVDLLADAANCGACGMACPADEICFGGQCARDNRS
jgi:hypothetical protein